MAYTAVITVSTGDLWTAANQNTYLRDNMTALAADRSKDIIIPAVFGYNQSDSIALLWTQVGWNMTDNKVCYGVGFWNYPYDFSASLTVKPIVYTNSSGNLYFNNTINIGADGEAYNTHTDGDVGYGTEAITASQYNVLSSDSITSANSGDFFLFVLTRDGTDASDTVNDTVQISGWLLEYSEANYG